MERILKAKTFYTERPQWHISYSYLNQTFVPFPTFKAFLKISKYFSQIKKFSGLLAIASLSEMRYYKYLQFPPRKHPPNIGKSSPYLDKSFLHRKSSGYFQTIPFVPPHLSNFLAKGDKCFSSICKFNLCKGVSNLRPNGQIGKMSN